MGHNIGTYTYMGYNIEMHMENDAGDITKGHILDLIYMGHKITTYTCMGYNTEIRMEHDIWDIMWDICLHGI